MMTCSLYLTFRGRIRAEKYKSVEDLALAYEGAKDRYRPAWGYDETGALILGNEPEGFQRSER
jgi:hypothetical protein